MKEKFENVVEAFKITKAKDLIEKIQNEPDPKIVWNGIVEGSKGLIVGVSKTGKTTFAENLAISLAVGKKNFFDYDLPGIPEKVLFINLEESFRVRSRRNLKQLSVLNDSERKQFDENYYSTPENFPEFLLTDKDWENVTSYIEEINPKYVFIDSLSHMFEGQIEQSDPAMKFVKKFRKYITSLNKTVIVVHHNTKGNDKPISQENIAGSRVIAQEFEYAIGLSNIPTQSGNYLCSLYNKYVENDDTIAILYKVRENNWVENMGECNKFDLYKENINRVDYRFDSTNKDLVYRYIFDKSQDSQSSLTVNTSDIAAEFVTNGTMSKDTLYSSLNKLMEENKIIKVQRGNYTIAQC